MLATIRRTARFAKIAGSQPARHPPVSRGQAAVAVGYSGRLTNYVY